MPSDIKTYKLKDNTDTPVFFDIKKMEEIYTRTGGKIDKPHRHDFYIILLVLKAKGEHIIDFNTYKLTDHLVFFISPGQVHQLKEDQKSYGWVITFSKQFLSENNIDCTFIEDIKLFNNYGQSPPLSLSRPQEKTLTTYSHQIFDLHHSKTKFKTEATGALLKLFLIFCNNICDPKTKNPQQIQAGATILKEYKNLVENNYTNWHRVHQYAQALHVTPDHLNRTIKSLIGKTAKEYLQSRIMISAKRSLYFSDKNTKEIAYELGFSEPANFSNFFKKHTGASPSKFRQSKNIAFL